MSENQSGEPFSPWRAYLWPVHRHEFIKLIPMLLMFFFISFDYNVLRTLKDSLLITAKSSGAEVIPFVKVWAMFPGAVAMTLLYTWLSNRFSREKVMYIITFIFLAYFFIFTFILYPIRDSIHPHALADSLELCLPIGCKGLIAMFRYWTFTLFYVASELWGNIILFLLFWGFANQITKLNEAKRFYGLLGVGANFSGIFAGQVSVYCCSLTDCTLFSFAEDNWHQSLIILVVLILCSALIALLLLRWIHSNVLTDSRYYDPSAVKKEEVQGKLSLRESIGFIMRSKYLLGIAIIMIAYNLVINLTEVLWKSQVTALYPNPNDYTLYMNEIVSIIGVVATLSSLLVSGNAVRKWGWTFTAMLTPIILLIMGSIFFGSFFLKEFKPDLLMTLWSGLSNPLILVAFLGSAQNVLSRGAKYSVFDATKEMLFVPLNPESKVVGKAAIDGVCSRLGKSGGSVIYQALLLTFSTITASAPYVMLSLVIIIAIWMFTVRQLGHQFTLMTSQKDTVPEEAKPARAPGMVHILPGRMQEQQAI